MGRDHVALGPVSVLAQHFLQLPEFTQPRTWSFKKISSRSLGSERETPTAGVGG